MNCIIYVHYVIVTATFNFFFKFDLVLHSPTQMYKTLVNQKMLKCSMVLFLQYLKKYFYSTELSNLCEYKLGWNISHFLNKKRFIKKWNCFNSLFMSINLGAFEFIPYNSIFDNTNKSEIKKVWGSKINRICTYLKVTWLGLMCFWHSWHWQKI